MRHVLRRVTIVLASFMALGAGLKMFSPNAEASYGFGDALETVGISTGIGTVLGLSTIVFYDEPTSHTKNALMGAGAGLLVGLGVAGYLMTTSDEGDDISPEELLKPQETPKGTGTKPAIDPTKAGNKKTGARKMPRHDSFLSSVPVALALPTHKQWAVAMRVLELRF